MKDIVERLNLAKAQVKAWEAARKKEGLDAEATKRKKAEFIGEINNYLTMKKAAKEARGKRGALFGANAAAAADGATAEAGASSSSPPAGPNVDTMTTQELMDHGRKTIKASDESLARSVKVVNETMELGRDTAVKLKEQTSQMERVVDELDEITFNLKKAGNVIRDMTRSMATDKCIQVFLLIIAIGVVVIIALKATGRDKGRVKLPGEKSDDADAATTLAQVTTAAPAAVRRMLRELGARRL